MKEQNLFVETKVLCKEIPTLSLKNFKKAVTTYILTWILILIPTSTSLKFISTHTDMEVRHLRSKQNYTKKNKFLNFHLSLNLNKTRHSVKKQTFHKMDSQIQSVTHVQMQLKDICLQLQKTKKNKGFTVKTLLITIKDQIY